MNWLNGINQNSNQDSNSNTLNINNILENLIESIQVGKYEDAFINYFNLKKEEYSLNLREIQKIKNENKIPLNANNSKSNSNSPSHKNNNKNVFKNSIQTIDNFSESSQIKIAHTKNILKKFKSTQDKLLTDLILRKHSSKSSYSSSEYKMNDSFYSFDVYKSFEDKISFDNTKDLVILPQERKFVSSMNSKANSIETFQDDVINKINIDENLFDGNQKFKSNENVMQSNSTMLNKEDPVIRNKNLLNNVIDVKLKIFQPIFD